MARRERNDKGSPLLRLPAELRIEIYKYALGGNEITICHWVRSKRPVILSGRYGDEAKSTERWTQLFSLGRTCHRIYSETELLIYSQNVFNSDFMNGLGPFLNQLDTEKRDAIRTISIGFRSGSKKFGRAYHMTKGVKSLSERDLDKCKGLATIIRLDDVDPPVRSLSNIEAYAELHALRLIHEKPIMYVEYHPTYERH
jgi:hypothetical protein